MGLFSNLPFLVNAVPTADADYVLRNKPSAAMRKLLMQAQFMDDEGLLGWLQFGSRLQRKAVRLVMGMRVAEGALEVHRGRA